MTSNQRDELLIRIDEKLGSLDQSFRDHVENHNEDVYSLEKSVDDLKGFKKELIGAGKFVLWILAPIITGVVVWYLKP